MNEFKSKPVNIPKITILLDHGYHPDYLTKELERVYPQIGNALKKLGHHFDIESPRSCSSFLSRIGMGKAQQHNLVRYVLFPWGLFAPVFYHWDFCRSVSPLPAPSLKLMAVGGLWQKRE